MKEEKMKEKQKQKQKLQEQKQEQQKLGQEQQEQEQEQEQRSWRDQTLIVSREVKQVQEWAAVAIGAIARGFLVRCRAVCAAEAAWALQMNVAREFSAINIQSVARGYLVRGSSSTASTGPKFGVGDKAEVSYRDTGRYYKGAIIDIVWSETETETETETDTSSYTYKIKYDDGERERNVTEDRIRAVGAVADFMVGEAVEHHRRNAGRYYPCVVDSGPASDGTYSVKYPPTKWGDGPIECKIPCAQLRQVKQFEIRQKVEVNYGGKGTFYRGAVGSGSTAVEAGVDTAADEVYDIVYEDGDMEAAVSRQLIR